MKIIDFEIKGNQVKFYVGSDSCNDYYGDDWDDKPYEHNAGPVYSQFVIGYFVKTFDFDDVVMEPSDGHDNSYYCKDDMREGKVPCVVVLPKEFKEKYTWYYHFEDISNNQNAIKFFFNDKVDETKEDIHYMRSIDGEDNYICFSFEKNKNKSVIQEKAIRLASNIMSQIFKSIASDEYRTQICDNGCKKLKEFAELETIENKFNECLKFACESLETPVFRVSHFTRTTGRSKPYSNDTNVYICYESNDDFKIGEVDFNFR